MAKITVYTKTFNRMTLLPRTIESVLDQTFSDFEYVIFNNGSTDDTRSVIDAYAKQDNRIRILSREKNILDGEPEAVFTPDGENIRFIIWPLIQEVISALLAPSGCFLMAVRRISMCMRENIL